MYLDDTTEQDVGTAGFQYEIAGRRLHGRLERRWLLPVRQIAAHLEAARPARRPHLRRRRCGARSANGQIVCNVSTTAGGAAAFPGCQPLNLFGRGNASPGAARLRGRLRARPVDLDHAVLSFHRLRHRALQLHHVRGEGEPDHLLAAFRRSVVLGRHHRDVGRQDRGRIRRLVPQGRDLPARAGRHQPDLEPRLGPSGDVQHLPRSTCAGSIRATAATPWATSSPRSPTSAAPPRCGRPSANCWCRSSRFGRVHTRSPTARCAGPTIRARARSGPTRAASSSASSRQLRVRGTYSRDVRAANLSERFDRTGGFANVTDPRNLPTATRPTTPPPTASPRLRAAIPTSAGRGRHLDRRRGGAARCPARLLGQRRLLRHRDRRRDQHGGYAVGGQPLLPGQAQEFCDLIALADGTRHPTSTAALVARRRPLRQRRGRGGGRRRPRDQLQFPRAHLRR